MTARLLAYNLLTKAEKSQQYSNIALDNALTDSKLGEADRRLASALFYGVTEKKITLDWRIAQLSSRPVAELDISVLTALRMGLYQLIFLDRIPVHAAINETVKLCSKKSSGFVNAILRAHTRQGDITFPKQEDTIVYLSVKYSVCKELAKKLTDCFGEQTSEDILRGFDKKSDITLRVNTLKTTTEVLAKNIQGAVQSELCPHALYVNGSVRELYGFDEGLFFVQDCASQLAVSVLDARPHQTVLDICACPGSKSFGAALAMENKGKIISFDLHENKLSLVRSGALRLGIDIIETQAHDGRDFIPELKECADRVICDVPCSGFGVLSKKPELRYKDPQKSAQLPKIQRDILNTASKYVKRGGLLVYSTCTILPEENGENIMAFLDEHKDFHAVPFCVGDISAPAGMLTLYPHIHGTDGFFIAKLIRE